MKQKTTCTCCKKPRIPYMEVEHKLEFYPVCKACFNAANRNRLIWGAMMNSICGKENSLMPCDARKPKKK